MVKLWQSPAYLTYVQPELTDELVSKFEKETNYKLPLEFINLLKIQNGGYIRYSLEDIPHEVIYGIGPNLPKIEKPDWSLEKEHVSFKLEGLIPFDGDGHWNLCLDYRESNSKPKITYIDKECDSQSLIANSFNEYLLLLEIDTEKKYVIETNNSTEDTILAISNSLKKKFEEPDSWAHGYPIYRTKYRKEWIWISPNQVNQGFIREEDSRYSELKNLIKGIETRFPEIPKRNLIMSVSSENIVKKIFRKLEKNSITIKSFESYFI